MAQRSRIEPNMAREKNVTMTNDTLLYLWIGLVQCSSETLHPETSGNRCIDAHLNIRLSLGNAAKEKDEGL